MKTLTAIGTAIALVAGMAMAQANQSGITQEKTGAAQSKMASDDAKVIATQMPSYPLTTCAISGEDLDGMDGAMDLVVEGRLVRVCCKSCVKKVKADPAKSIAKVDAAVIKAQKAGYPLTTCPITKKKLGSMGAPINIVHGTRLVQVCCKGCIKAFKKAPAKTMEKIDAALIAKQLKTYKLKTCIVSDEALTEGDTVEFLYGTQLMRTCCKSCMKTVKKNPKKYLAKLK